jgi:thiamine thiazole synthase
MNVAVVQEEAVALLDEMGIRCEPKRDNLYAVDAIELAAGLCWNAIQVGVRIFNLMSVEDLCLRHERVTGVVVNRTTISGVLPVDPIVFSAKATLDATGHEAVLVECLRKRRLLSDSLAAAGTGEGPMDATAGEDFVIAHAGQVFPGLWLSGMSVSATLAGPRMGPIFGGMLLSGKRVAEAIMATLGQAPQERPAAP